MLNACITDKNGSENEKGKIGVSEELFCEGVGQCVVIWKVEGLIGIGVHMLQIQLSFGMLCKFVNDC